MKVECRDIDNSSGTDYDTLGFAEFELGTLMGSRQNMLLLDLMNKGKKEGVAVVRSEKVSRENYAVSVVTVNRRRKGVSFFRASLKIG